MVSTGKYNRVRQLVMGSFSDEQDDNLVLVYRFIETHTYLIGKNDKCQNPKFKSNLHPVR